MQQTNDRWLDHTGLNLIRIVIGSYFMAISLGLVAGINPATLFAPLVPAPLDALAGATLLFALSVGFMAGAWLRFFALSLALFVLCSSIADNGAGLREGIVAPFWRDLALVAAVLLSYASLRRRELRRAAVVLRRRATRMRGGVGPVRPRRVAYAQRAAPNGPDRRGGDMSLRPALPVTGPVPRTDPVSPAQRKGAVPLEEEDEEIVNIFVNL